MNKPLLVTMGDPAGIGIDVTLKAFAKGNLPHFILLADPSAVAERCHELKLDVKLQETDLSDSKLSIKLLVAPLNNKVKSLKPSEENAPAIIESIERAVEAVHKGEARGVVTNPIAKYILMKAGFKYAGHTDFLGELTNRFWGINASPVMLLWSNELAVIPITVHIPLKDVPAKLTQQLIIETVKIAAKDYETRFKIKNPRLAFCGLNPHAGDEGMMGLEDELIVKPAVLELKQQGFNVTGVFAADTLFHPRARANYDLCFGMYHDQVLIPMKTLAFDEGVNVTLGLPFIRTSPDHGTAFDIAGTGKAREESFVEALKLADRLS